MATTLENGVYGVAVSGNPTSGTDDYYVNDDYNYSVDKLQHDYVWCVSVLFMHLTNANVTIYVLNGTSCIVNMSNDAQHTCIACVV